VERFFTIFWLLLIPTQLGRHFWLSESSIFGARIDYLSIILYATDLAWILWVVNKLRIKPPALRAPPLMKGGFKKLLNFQNLILLLFIMVNVVMAEARWVAIYKWLRVFQWMLTIYLVKVDKKKIKKYLMMIVPVWIIGESFLGLLQVMNGGSLNGIWWWFGERSFVYGGIGIAQMDWLGQNLIRAYGTFSHPNSMAGFLLLSWWYFKSNLSPVPFFDTTGARNILLRKIFYWIVNWSALMGILVAGSRTVWGITAVMLIVEQLPIINFQLLTRDKKIRRQLIGKILMILGVICLFLGIISINYRLSDFVGGWDANGLAKREVLIVAAVKMIQSSPLFGVGAGNFVKELPKVQNGNWSWLQPVHNIFLLVWSEIGLLGIIILSVIGYQLSVTNFKWKKYWWLWVIVGVTGMVDHYWISLPQNSWLLAVILGLV
jgi:O-antigen ligase